MNDFNIYNWIQSQLSIGGVEALRDACALNGVDVKDYPEHQLMLLDYNQIEATDNNPVSDNCRGLLIDYDGNIVRRGFKRFYNATQAGWDIDDVAESVVAEKADGSLCFIYWCEKTNQFELGTRGTAFAEGPNDWHGTFREFFLNCLGVTETQFQIDCGLSHNKEYSYIYEMIGPDNRIVTKYEMNHAVFLSSFENKTGKEYLTYNQTIWGNQILKPVNWDVRPVKLYSFGTKEECLASLANLPDLAEGYVVFNPKTGNRVKVKSPAYVAAHRLRGNGLNMNSICELVVMNEYDEYLAVFPEDKEKFTKAIAEYMIMRVELNSNYLNYCNIESQKDFALAVKDLPLSCVMFKTRKSDNGIMYEFDQFPVSKRANWLKERLV